jgi:hypothetical protein
MQGRPCCLIEYSAVIEKLKPVSQVQAKLQEILEYGTPLIRNLPAQTDFWTLSAQTSTLQKIELVKDQSSDLLAQKKCMSRRISV